MFDPLAAHLLNQLLQRQTQAPGAQSPLQGPAPEQQSHLNSPMGRWINAGALMKAIPTGANPTLARLLLPYLDKSGTSS
jgi:hypothetical protein